MTLRTVTERPYNAEASLAAVGAYVTPVSEFYVRNNFDVPVIDAAAWRLRVHGLVDTPIELDLAALKKLPQVTRRLTLECAGNGRRLMDPPTEGTPWGLGAAGTAIFTGVLLRNVLRMAGPMGGALECVFAGNDGKPDGGFRRSLPLQVCLADDGPLVVWEMNGEPLTREHGFPVRLVVPNWYAVASVKWLVDIELIDHAFAGYFQADRYVYRGGGGMGSGNAEGGGAADVPVTLMRVRSLITSHADGIRVNAGEHVVEGVAWSGMGGIERVEVAVASAAESPAPAETPAAEASAVGAWLPATVAEPDAPGAAVRWRCPVHLSPGRRTLLVRATDSSGATQHEQPGWNELGYGFNVIHRVSLLVD